MNTLLVEIRTEELPPKVVWDFSDSFPDMLLTALKKSGFADDNAQRAKNNSGINKQLATPRRLAALLQNIKPESAAAEIYRRGPQLVACYDSEKNPTKALIGFMHSVGVTCEKDLIQIKEKGKDYIAWKGMQAGKKLSDELATIVANVLFNLPSPRLMRWGDNDFKFARPINGILMLHDDKHISGTIMNIAATKTTPGHPVLSKGEIAINHANDYENEMRNNNVLVDINERCKEIYKQRKNKCRKEISEDAFIYYEYEVFNSVATNIPNYGSSREELIREIAAMSERPQIYIGNIDKDLLSLPKKCIIMCMEKHQRCFAVLKEWGGDLLPNYFLVTDNIPTHPENMLRGYDSVLRARLRDVKFYYETDKKPSLDEYVEKLKSIIFHNKLGNQHARINRVCKIAVALGYPKEEIEETAKIILAPLSTLMVNEYPELQEHMGGTYFIKHGKAKGHHFGLVCRLYDLEKIVAMFGIGEIATGSKDPHGLRRDAYNLAKELSLNDKLIKDLDKLRRDAHNLAKELSEDVYELSKTPSIRKLIAAAVESFDGKIADVANEVYDFILDRKKFMVHTIRPQTKESVFSQKPDSFLHIQDKIIAVHHFSIQLRSECKTLAAADKRIKNILRKSNMDAHSFVAPDESLFAQDEERVLWNCLKELQIESNAQIKETDFAAALQTLAKSATPIDTFFDKVLVNAEDEKIRNNRFALLNKTKELLNQVCDISKLESRHD